LTIHRWRTAGGVMRDCKSLKCLSGGGVFDVIASQLIML